MRVASAMILLLYCGVAASTAAVNNDVALADGDAALKDDTAALRARVEALEQRASERDSSLEGQEKVTNRMILKAINGGQQQLLLGQIREQVTQMGAKIRVLEAQTTADTQTLLSQISERVTQMGAKILVVEAQTAAGTQTLSQMGVKIQTLEAQTAADAQTLSQMGANIRVLKAQTTADALTLQNMSRQLERATKDGAGASTFVRWGSSTCGGNASGLVYSGVVGGGSHDQYGAAVNYLCLTLSPRPSQQAYNRGVPYAELYGGEYETHDSQQDKDPVCAVCRAAFSTTVMIPGTDTCTLGWRLQYSGFLMAGYVTQKKGTEFICVDHAHESAQPGANGNENGALLYFTKTTCGSLPCGPYVNNNIVACAVCSK